MIFLQRYIQICRGTATDLELFLRLQILNPHPIVIGDRLLNHFDGDRFLIGVQDLAQRLLGQRQGYFSPVKRAIGD